MKAAYVTEYGPAEAIRYGTLPDPVPGPGQVLVRTVAVAVDSVDTLVRSGRWRTPVSFPLVVGRDLVGTLPSGELVWTNSAGYGGRPGATADLVAVAEDRLYPLPAGADPAQFVAAVHPGATAYGALVDRARLRAGETVCVIGANGAVGCCMVQVAAALGARPVAIVRSAPAADRLRALGAASVVVSASPSLADVPAGVDVLVDASGRVDQSDVLDVLAPRGRVVLIAGPGELRLERWRFYIQEAELIGFIMSGMTVPELTAAAAWLNEHRPVVAVAPPLPFADTARAHALVESGEAGHDTDGLALRLVLRP